MDALINSDHAPAGTSPVSHTAEKMAMAVRKAVMRTGITIRRDFILPPINVLPQLNTI